MGAFQLFTLGRADLYVDGNKVSIHRQGIALLAVLALSRELTADRTHVAELLWDGSSGPKKKHSLTQLLYTLARVAPGLISKSRHRLALSSDMWVDFAELRGNGPANLTNVHTLYGGPLLRSLPFVSEAFEEWRTGQAANIELQALARLEEAISFFSDAEQYDKAALAAERALDISPLDENFACARIEALAASGDTNRALREFDFHKRRIHLETGATPRLLTDQLRDRIITLTSMRHDQVTRTAWPFVGRRNELQLLKELWRDSSAGPSLAFIRGETGIGKTRLLQQILRRTAIEGGRVFSHVCSEAESSLPFSGVAGVLRDGFRRGDTTRLQPYWLEVLTSLAPELFDDPAPKQYAPRITAEALAQYFLCVEQVNPIVLAIDNDNWVDETSRAVISYVIGRLSDKRLLLICAGHASIENRVDAPFGLRSEEIYLNELSLDEAHEFICKYETRHRVAIDPSVKELILERVGGRPIFLTHALDISGNHRAHDTALADTLSKHISEYVAHRLKGLNKTTRDLAIALACLGRPGAITLLAAITETSVSAAVQALRELVDSGILADEPVARFRHEVYRHALVHLLSNQQRAGWHARIAHALDGNESSKDGEIAHHYEQAGDLPAARRYATYAATRASTIGAYSEATQEFRRALRCSHAAERLETLAQHAHLMVKVADFSALLQDLDQLEIYCRRTQNLVGVTACMLARFVTAEAQGASHDHYCQSAKNILSLAEECMPDSITDVLWIVGDSIRQSGDQSLLIHYADLLVEQAESAQGGHPAELLAAASTIGGLCLGYATSTALGERAVLAAQLTDNTLARVRAAFAYGTSQLWCGNVALAASLLTEALQDAGGDALHLTTSIRSNLAICLTEQGRFGEAEEMALRAVRESKASRRAYVIGNLALLELRRRNWDGLAQYATMLIESYSAAQLPWVTAHGHALRGIAYVRSGETTAATKEYDAAVSSQGAVDPLIHEAPLIILHSELLELQGNWSASLANYHQASGRVVAHDWISWARFELARAKCQAELGDATGAADLIARIATWALSRGASCLHEEATACTRN